MTTFAEYKPEYDPANPGKFILEDLEYINCFELMTIDFKEMGVLMISFVPLHKQTQERYWIFNKYFRKDEEAPWVLTKQESTN